MSPTALGVLPAPPQLAPPRIAQEFYVHGEVVRAVYADEATLRPAPNRGPLTAPVRAYVDPRQWSLAGAYTLLWPREADGRVPVYVGGTGDLLDRLASHEQTGWSHAVALTSHGLSKGAAHQLERGLGRALFAADPQQTLFVKRWQSLPSSQRGETPWALTAPLLILAERVLRHVGLLALHLDPQVGFA